MTTDAGADRERRARLAGAARAEAAGDIGAAVRAWRVALDAEPSWPVAMQGLAQALIRAGRPADALPLLVRATTLAPNLPAGWIALGVAHSMLDAHAQATDATARAVTLAPGVAAARIAHGDVLRVAGDLEGARRAYAKGVDLAPNDPDALNKLAGVERMARDFDAAEAHLARALAVAPDHPYASVNFGTLAIERGDAVTARQRLAAALGYPRLPRDAADEASSTLEMLDEHATLAPALERAAAAAEPGPIDTALRANRAARRRDEALVALFDDVIARASAHAPIDAEFAKGPPSNDVWPAIEAHHNLRLPGDMDAIGATIAVVAHAADEPASRPIADYAAAVAQRGEDKLVLVDGIAWEAWLRWTHFRLFRTVPAFWPGQVKPVGNFLRDSPRTARTAPIAVAGTVRAIMPRIDAALPPGAWRACLHYYAIIQIHPFHDGNGRLARFVLNRSLTQAGLHPIVRPDNDEEGVTRLVNDARDSRDLTAVAKWFAHASHHAAALDVAWRGKATLTTAA